jgi:hypothetical protein
MRRSDSKWLVMFHPGVPLPAARRRVLLVHEDDSSPAVNPAVAIIEAVDRSVELIVAPHRHQQELARLEAVLRDRGHGELGSLRLGNPAALAGGVGKVERPFRDPCVEVGKPGDDPTDVIADPAVVRGKLVPLDLGPRPESRLRDSRHDLRLALEPV